MTYSYLDGGKNLNNLKMLENDLVPVYVTSMGEKVVYGSELYECLGSKRQYTDWIKNRLSDCDAVENEDYQSFSQNCEKPTGGRPKQEYVINLDTAKEMAMLERNDKGKQVRRYFISIEKKYRENKVPMSTSGQIHLLAQGYTYLEEKVDTVEKKVDHLENTMVIDYTQQKQLKKLASEVVVNALGGNEAKAYRYRDENGKSMSKCVFSRFWHDFYDYFGINAYANLPKVRFDEALEYTNCWKPPINMQLEIGTINRMDDIA